jgi:hypothetical protein
LRVWIHDSLFPVLAAPRSIILGGQQKFQTFVQADCYLRSIASGASWTVLLDLDEFVYPSHRMMRVPLPQHLDEAVPKDLLHVWVSSYLFHTWHCFDPGPAHIQDRMRMGVVAIKDEGTYGGRRKGIHRTPKDVLFAAQKIFPLVHDVIVEVESVSRNRRMLDWFHIHHFREAWYEHVCNKTVGIDPLPATGNWSIHPDCDQNIRKPNTIHKRIPKQLVDRGI